MIGLFALVIAFLTLLSPSPEAQVPIPELPDAMADTAIVAGGPDALLGLLGRWDVRITPSDSASTDAALRDDIVLEIRQGTTGDEAAYLAFGPPEELWTGEVTCCGQPGAAEFVSRARCASVERDVAHIAGRVSDGKLRGTLYLEADAEMVTWTAARR